MAEVVGDVVRTRAGAVVQTFRGVAAATSARPKVFASVALAVFVLNLFLPVLVLSLARKPVDYFTFNPWLSRLPEYVTSREVPLSRKLEFLSGMALAWFFANNPIEGVEWGFIIDVPSLLRFVFSALLFGAYFALWFHLRDRMPHRGRALGAARHGGAAGALTSVLGFSTGACSVMGCGVPVLPVVGLAFTGVSSGVLAFFGSLARVATLVVLGTMTLGAAYLAGGRRRGEEPCPLVERLSGAGALRKGGA